MQFHLLSSRAAQHAAPEPLSRRSYAIRSQFPRPQAVNESTARGITLIELLVVMAIISLMISISYPTLTAGLDGIRLRTSLDRAGAFFHAARQEADRRQQPVQFTVDPEHNRLTAVTIDSGWQDELGLPDAIHIAYPKVEQNLLLFPGSPAPALRLLLEARDGSRGGFQISVFTGAPEKWQGPQEAER